MACDNILKLLDCLCCGNPIYCSLFTNPINMRNNYLNTSILGMLCLTINVSPSPYILPDNNFSATTKIVDYDMHMPSTTSNFKEVNTQDTVPITTEKIVIAGTFQGLLHCANDWDPSCPYTELTLNSSTGLYTGSFQVPAGSHYYKVAVGGSFDISYGENGIFQGADIPVCISSDSEEITFIFDPSTNLVTTLPITSGFSPDCLPIVVLAGSFQNELGCVDDWVADCTNAALTYNVVSGLFEGHLYIPPGCYEYRVVLENSWQTSFGQEGIYNGPNYIISIPEDPENIHFTYDLLAIS